MSMETRGVLRDFAAMEGKNDDGSEAGPSANALKKRRASEKFQRHFQEESSSQD